MGKATSIVYQLFYKIWKSNAMFAQKIVFNNICTTPLFIIMVVIEILQFDSFIYYYLSLILPVSNIITIIDKIFYYISFGFITTLNTTFLLTILIILFAYMAASIILYYLFSQSKTKKLKIKTIFGGHSKQYKNSLFFKIYSILYLIVLPVAEFGLFKMFFTSFSCTNFAKSTKNFICFRGIHLVVLCFASLFIVLYIIRITFIQFLINDYNPNTNLPTASVKPYLPLQLLKLNKLIGTIFIVFDKNKTLFALSMIVHLLFNGGIVFIIIIFPPLYHDTLSIVTIFAHTHVAFFSLIAFILTWVAVKLNISLLVMCFIVSFVLGIVTIKIRENIMKNKLKTLFKVEKTSNTKLYALSYIMPRLLKLENSIENQLEIEGIIRDHNITCNQMECFCLGTSRKQSKKYYSTKHMQSFDKSQEEKNSFLSESKASEIMPNKKEAIHFFHYYLVSLSERFPGDAILTLFLSYFQNSFYKSKKILSSIYNASKAKEKKITSPAIKMATNKHFVKLYYVFKKYYLMKGFSDKEKVKIQNLIQTENYRSTLIEGISVISKYIFNFWMGILKLDMSGIELLLSASDKINDAYDLLESIIYDSTKICGKSIKILSLIQNYYSEIANDSEKAAKYQNIIEDEKKKKEYEKETLRIRSSSDYAVIAMSGRSFDIGTIIYVSKNINLYSDYTPTDLVERSHEILMPQFIERVHREIVQNFISESKSGFTDCTVLIKRKSQYLELAEMSIIPLFNLSKGLTFIATIMSSPCPVEIKKYYSNQESYLFFVCNEANDIIGLNENFGKKFEINPSDQQDEKQISALKLFTEEELNETNKPFSKVIELPGSSSPFVEGKDSAIFQVFISTKDIKSITFPYKIVHMISNELKIRVSSVMQSELQPIESTLGFSNMSKNESMQMQIPTFNKNIDGVAKKPKNPNEKILCSIVLIVSVLSLVLYLIILLLFNYDRKYIRDGCQMIALTEKGEYLHEALGLLQLTQIVYVNQAGKYFMSYQFDSIMKLNSILNLKYYNTQLALLIQNQYSVKFFSKYNDQQFQVMQTNNGNHFLINQNYSILNLNIISLIAQINKLSQQSLTSIMNNISDTTLFNMRNKIDFFIYNYFTYTYQANSDVLDLIKNSFKEKLESTKIPFIVILTIAVTLYAVCLILIIKQTRKTFLMKADVFGNCIQCSKATVINILQKIVSFRKNEYLIEDDEIDNKDFMMCSENQGKKADNEDMYQKIERISYQLSVSSKGKTVLISILAFLTFLLLSVYLIVEYISIINLKQKTLNIISGLEKLEIYMNGPLRIGSALLLYNYFPGSYELTTINENIQELFDNLMLFDDLRNNKIYFESDISALLLDLDSGNFCQRWVDMVGNFSNMTGDWFLNSLSNDSCNSTYDQIASLGLSHVISNQYQEYEIMLRDIDNIPVSKLIHTLEMQIMINIPLVYVFESAVNGLQNIFYKQTIMNISIFATQNIINILLLLFLFRKLVRYLSDEIKKMEGVNKIYTKKLTKEEELVILN